MEGHLVVNLGLNRLQPAWVACEAGTRQVGSWLALREVDREGEGRGGGQYGASAGAGPGCE